MDTRQIGISPKLIAAVVAAVLAHIAADPLLELPAWADYVLQALATGVAAYLAPPGNTATRHRADDIGAVLKPRPKRKPQAGYSIVEVLVIALVCVLLIIAVVALLRSV